MKRIAAAALVLALSLAATTVRAMLSAPPQRALADAAAVRAKAALGKPAPDLVANASRPAAVGALLEALPRAPKPAR